MENKGIIFAAFFFSSLFITPAPACQPEPGYPYLIELEDEKHIFVMGAEYVDYKDYYYQHFDPEYVKELKQVYLHEKSGLYPIGQPDKPLWIWDGGFINDNLMTTGLSPDGKYFLYINHIGMNGKGVLAYLFKDGDLVREYGIEPFIENTEQAVRVPCDYPRWARHWEFDEVKNHYKVETYTGRIVNIDAESGAIVSVNQVQVKNVVGKVQLRNGDHFQVSHVGICSDSESKEEDYFPPGMEALEYHFTGRNTEMIRDSDGLTDVPAIVISSVDEVEQAGDDMVLKTISAVLIRIDHISKMEFEPVPKSDKVLAKLELIDLTRFDWLISSNGWSFCASKQQGSYISLNPPQLEKIILFNPPPDSPST